MDCWNYELNKDCTPRTITISNNKKFYYFDCDNCFHTFSKRINDITNKNTWCSYCGDTMKVLCEDEDCEFCFNNSFASFTGLTQSEVKKVDCWSYELNNGVKPRDKTLSTIDKFWFNCPDCPHSFEVTLNHITQTNGTWCPYCCYSVKKLCLEDECLHCFNKSFASYDQKTLKDKLKVDCWNEKDIIPRMVIKNTNTKYSFICDECDKPFEASLKSIVGLSSWCSLCRNKTEKYFNDWFNKKYPEHRLKSQPKYTWCKNEKTNRLLPFDFVIEDMKLIIEIDGEQHFSQVSNWNSPEDIFIRDKYKMECAMINGYSIVRILQQDIYCNINDWKSKFDRVLEKYEKPEIICIGCEIKYTKYNDIDHDIEELKKRLIEITEEEKEQEKLEKLEKLFCNLCNKGYKQQNHFDRHCKSKEHLKKVI